MEITEKKTINSLQFLRFIAILFVFYTHITSANIIYATCGVSFFVILSGFLYGYKKYDNKTNIITGTVSLLKKKISKFYLLHLVTLILSISLEPIVTSTSIVIKNLLLLQCYSKTHYFAFNGVSWFLSLMIILAIITIPLKAIIVKLDKIGKKNITLIFTFILLIVVNFVYCYKLNRMNVNLQYWLYVCPIPRILEYTCGMIIGYLVAKNILHISNLLGTILEITSLGIVALILMIPNIPQYIHRNFIWVIPMCLVLVIFSLEKGYISKLFSNKYLMQLGNISFEFFMTHQVILRYVDKYKLLDNIPFVGKFVIELITSVLVAQLVSYCLKRIKIDIVSIKKDAKSEA